MKIVWRPFVLVADPLAKGGLVGAKAMDTTGIAARVIGPPAEEED